MMVKIKTGDLLEADEKIIAHQKGGERTCHQ